MRSALWCVILSACYACTSSSGANEKPANEASTINHFNIMVAVDLSNRQNTNVHPRPLTDDKIIKVVLDNIYPTILNHGRKQNQRDRFSVKIINKQLISHFGVNSGSLIIAFDKFDTQLERIDYIKNRSSKSGFSTDTAKFMTEFKRIQRQAIRESYGADIWSFLNEGISANDLMTGTFSFEYDGRVYNEHFRNILIILTDGYIEADFYGKQACDPQNTKQCFYLSGKRIDAFREAYRALKMPDLREYFESSQAGLIPVKNPSLQNLEILVLELHDRSISSAGNATTHPTDMEIIKLFWKDWLSRSGVNRFETWQSMTTTEEAEKVILNFLNVQNQ